MTNPIQPPPQNQFLSREPTILETVLGSLVIIVGLLLLLALGFWLQWLGTTDYGERLKCNAVEIFYLESVTERKAQELCEHLTSAEMTEGEKERSIQLDRKEGVYIVRFVISEDMYTDEELLFTLQMMANGFSKHVFDASKVEVHICDTGFNSITILHSETETQN